MSPLSASQKLSTRYQSAVDSGLVHHDAQQWALCQRLDILRTQLQSSSPPTSWLSRWLRIHAKPIQGIYIYGPVGRGKTMLMDWLTESLPGDMAHRCHFHHFMAQVHRALNQFQGHKDPLQQVARQWQSVRLLCFDEFFVSDIGDAMLMSGLMSALFQQGTALVATSNCHPDQLYQDGLQRSRFLPTIDLLKQHCDLYSLAGTQDHRLRFGHHQTYFSIQEESRLWATFRRLEGEQRITESHLRIQNRLLPCLAHGSHGAVFRFSALCEGPRSQRDYIELADLFERIYLTQVPLLSPQESLHTEVAQGTEDGYQRGRQRQYAQSDNAARRFIALVDECYDRGVLLVMDAEVPISSLYPQGSLSFEFARTESRLTEMQTDGFRQRLPQSS